MSLLLKEITFCCPKKTVCFFFFKKKNFLLATALGIIEAEKDVL
jgi:hypothetical protein